MKKVFYLILLTVLTHSNSFAWIYPEHRDISLLAIQKLSPENRAILDSLWAEARKGHENRLTDVVIDATQSIKPTRLDYAALPAISGDHSSSPENMLFNALQTDWILKVADITAQLKIDIANSKTRSQHINAIRNSDIRLQRADPKYVTRAGSNNVHFLLARPDVHTTLKEYLTTCLIEGANLNALGAYSWFHASALLKAARYANESLPPAEKSKLALSALADEAFALHFLQDIYAAGHVAGTWGSASQRKGTHDYYNEKGLEVVTWDDQRMILMGDAFMRPEDADVTAFNVRLSLEQFLNAASGKLPLDYKSDVIALVNEPDSLNISTSNLMPKRTDLNKLYAQLEEVLVKTPVPGLADGLGELPRFQSELGMFVGVSPSIRSSLISSGFGPEQTRAGYVGGIEASVRFGLGLDGVLNESGDGLVFVDVGWRQDHSATNQIVDSDALTRAGAITSAIPGRDAFNFRLRMPFWLIPGDLLVAGPILLLASPQTLTDMAVAAVNGGFIPWQAAMATSVGRFQFILGREIGVYFYGKTGSKDVILLAPSNSPTTILEYSSIQLDIPILEYRPFRTFSSDQSSSLIIQITNGFDIPKSGKVILPEGGTAPNLKTTYFIGIRLTFNWRYYF
jgi:hypothetical protein